MFGKASWLHAAAVLLCWPAWVGATPFNADREFLFRTCASLHEYTSPDYAPVATRRGSVKLTDSKKKGLHVILDAWAEHGDSSKERLAYVLATARRESSNTFLPVREVPRCGNDEACRERKIGHHLAKKAAKHGRPPPANYALADERGQRYYGRGFVQLTKKKRYELAYRKTGVPVHEQPDRALEPGVAAEFLIRGMLEGWYGRSLPLSHYISRSRQDWFNARDTVNPRSPHKAITAQYAKDLLRCLRPVQPVLVTGTKTP
jgi:hypothetical protein